MDHYLMNRRSFARKALSAASGVALAPLLPLRGYDAPQALQTPKKAYAVMDDGCHYDITGYFSQWIESHTVFPPYGSGREPYTQRVITRWCAKDGTIIAQTHDCCLRIVDHVPTLEDFA